VELPSATGGFGVGNANSVLLASITAVSVRVGLEHKGPVSYLLLGLVYKLQRMLHPTVHGTFPLVTERRSAKYRSI